MGIGDWGFLIACGEWALSIVETIGWRGPKALDRHFGRGRWYFITLENKLDAPVTKRLRAEELSLPFFKTPIMTQLMTVTSQTNYDRNKSIT